MANTTLTASDAPTLGIPLENITPYAEKYQTVEMQWHYSPNLSIYTKCDLPGGRDQSNANGFPLSSTGGSEFNIVTHENDNIMLYKTRVTNRVVKKFLATGTAIVSPGSMSLSFSAYGDDVDGREYGASTAPLGLGMRGEITTLSSLSGDVGFIARELWDDATHTELNKSSGWVSNGVTIPRFWGTFIKDPGGTDGMGIPFSRIGLGQASADGTYHEQNADRVWLDSWYPLEDVAATSIPDPSQGNDATFDGAWVGAKIMELFYDPTAAPSERGVGPYTRPEVPDPKGTLRSFSRGLPAAAAPNFWGAFKDIWFPFIGPWANINHAVDAPFSKTNSAYVANDTTVVRNDTVHSVIKEAANGGLFGGGVLLGFTIQMQNTLNPRVHILPAPIETVVNADISNNFPFTDDWRTDYLNNVSCDLVTFVDNHSQGWGSFWGSSIPQV